MCKYQHGLLVNFGIRTQLLSTKQTGVVSCCKLSATLGPFVHNHHPSCRQCQSRTGGGPASFHSETF